MCGKTKDLDDFNFTDLGPNPYCILCEMGEVSDIPDTHIPRRTAISHYEVVDPEKVEAKKAYHREYAKQWRRAHDYKAYMADWKVRRAYTLMPLLDDYLLSASKLPVGQRIYVLRARLNIVLKLPPTPRMSRWVKRAIELTEAHEPLTPSLQMQLQNWPQECENWRLTLGDERDRLREEIRRAKYSWTSFSVESASTTQADVASEIPEVPEEDGVDEIPL